MRVLLTILNLLLRLLLAPFSGNDQTRDYEISPLTNVIFLKIALLRRSCQVATIKIGENEVKFSVIPRGFCANCCPLKMNREVRFMLYNNKENPENGIPIEPYNQVGAAKRAGIIPGAPTEIFIHGFTETSPGKSGSAVRDAYLSRPEPYNVILLDWSELSAFPWYRNARQNVKAVAQMLKTFLEVFHKSGEIPISSVHVIGFSLGSHIASFAGKQLNKGIRIPRITALDPAFPEYSLRDSSRRLTSSDADYIDVIHTDAGIFGLPISVGHADFYPNGGKALQPGCQPSYLARINIVEQVIACSHVRAWKLYAESVKNPEAFPATKCRNWKGPNPACNFTTDGRMGFGNNGSAFGQFFLVTNKDEPFGRALGQHLRI